MLKKVYIIALAALLVGIIKVDAANLPHQLVFSSRYSTYPIDTPFQYATVAGCNSSSLTRIFPNNGPQKVMSTQCSNNITIYTHINKTSSTKAATLSFMAANDGQNILHYQTYKVRMYLVIKGHKWLRVRPNTMGTVSFNKKTPFIYFVLFSRVF